MRSGRRRRGGWPRPPAPETDSAARPLMNLAVAFRRGQVIERLEAHHLEEPHRRPIKLWLARSRASPDLRDEIAQLEVAQHALAVDAADLFDARAGYGLLVGDDGKRFVRGL